jgi:hypothetical protein
VPQPPADGLRDGDEPRRQHASPSTSLPAEALTRRDRDHAAH